MSRASYLYPFLLLPLFGCGTELEITEPDSPFVPVSEAKPAQSISSATVVVPPTTDCAQNASAIQSALNAAEPGDVVQLTAGTYCVSEGIVVLNGFSGTLRGEGKDITIIEAVRGPGDEPFHFDFDSDYFPPGQGLWPTVLHFEFPADVTVRDLTMTESGPGHPGTYFQFIAVWGGNHTALFENLAFRGNPPTPEWLLGIHAMGGSQVFSQDGIGSVTVRDVEMHDVADGVDPMWYGEGSTILVENLRTTRAEFGIWGRGLASGLEITGSSFNESVYDAVFLGETNHARVTGNTFSGSGQTGLFLRDASNATVSGNTIRDQRFTVFWHSGIHLFGGVENTTVTENTFEDLSGETGQAILLWGLFAPVSGNTVHHNTFTHSGLPGWTGDSPNGPGAVSLDSGTFDNEVFEMKFPPGTEKTLCRMVWDLSDDGTTPEYDGVNSIHGWQPCENQAEREARKLGSGFGPDSRRGYR